MVFADPSPLKMEHALRRVRAEPWNYVAAAFYGSATMLAVVSVSTTHWLVAKNDGNMTVGLLSTCLGINGRSPDRICYSPQTVQPEWIMTFLFIVIGILGLTVATVANIVSFIRYPYEAQTVTRFAGLVAIVFFNLAQIVFPSAFGQDQIGGTAYQLPANFSIGFSYAMFFVSHWFCVISELCAAKICRPRWQF